MYIYGRKEPIIHLPWKKLELEGDTNGKFIPHIIFMRIARESSMGLALFMIKGTNKEDPLLEKVQPLMEEFSDLFIDNLPLRLPPLKGIQHAKDLILRLVLSNRPTYLMRHGLYEEL